MHLTDGPQSLTNRSNPTSTGTEDTGPGTPLWHAADLTCGGTVAQIDLSGQIYTLRITRAGKLILTK